MSPLDPEVFGRRVRRARLAKGLTLKDIEALVDISATHVSEVERGRTSPTVGALEKIAKAIGVDVPALIEPGADGRPAVTKRGSRMSLVLRPGELALEPLSSGDRDAALSLFLATLPAGARVAPRAGEPTGEDILEILDGALEVFSEHGEHVLDTGAVLHVKRVRSSPVFATRGDRAALFLWATTPALCL